MFRKYFIFFAVLCLPNFLFGQTNDFKIITQDVSNFWEAVDSLKNQKDTLKTFQNLVIDRASEEFKVFIRIWKIKASDYAYQISRYPKFYETLREQTNKLINSQDSIRKIVNRFQNLYPNFKQADICIAFGNFNTGGNIAIAGSRNLVYIGLEYHGLDTTTSIRELSASKQDYVSRSNFFRTIIHELVHIQQYTHGKKIIKSIEGNLLANRILREGIPDFISQLIVDKGNNGNYFTYGLKNENNLKAKLKIELWNIKSGNWFGGNDSSFIDKPRDLGYFMGSRIAKNFYNLSYRQKSNLTDLIEIKNVKKFIRESRYFENL